MIGLVLVIVAGVLVIVGLVLGAPNATTNAWPGRRFTLLAVAVLLIVAALLVGITPLVHT
jgi:hypothetical protein